MDPAFLSCLHGSELRTERSGAATQGVESATYRPQQGRKKAHWRIPPATRVRVRQRIRRWDGYLYNIDLFQYVERRLLDFIAWFSTVLYCTKIRYSTVHRAGGVLSYHKNNNNITHTIACNTTPATDAVTTITPPPLRMSLIAAWVPVGRQRGEVVRCSTPSQVICNAMLSAEYRWSRQKESQPLRI